MQSWDVLNLEADNQKLYYTTSKRCWNVCQLQYLILITRLLRIAEHALLKYLFYFFVLIYACCKA